MKHLLNPHLALSVHSIRKPLRFASAVGAVVVLCSAFFSSAIADVISDSVKVYLTRGGGALQNSNFQLARKNYEAALRLDSANVNALSGLGTIASAFGFQHQALKYFGDALKYGADEARTCQNIAVVYDALKQLDSSSAYYERSIKVDPENFEYIRNYGAALMSASEFSRALVQFQKALKVNPTDGETYYMIGNCYAALPDAKSAVESFKKAMDLGYDTGKLRYHLGLNCMALGDKYSAEEHLGFAVGKSPDSLQFRQMLAMFYLDQGVPDQARNFFRENLNRDSTFINSRIGLGVAFAYLGQMDSANIELANVRRVDKSRAEQMKKMIEQAQATLKLIDSLNNVNVQMNTPKALDDDDQ